MFQFNGSLESLLQNISVLIMSLEFALSSETEIWDSLCQKSLSKLSTE